MPFICYMFARDYGPNMVKTYRFPDEWGNIHFRTSYELIAEQQKTRSELIHAIAIQAEETMVRMGYITGWWLTYPSEKYEFVCWGYDIPNIWKITFMFQTTNQIMCLLIW